MIRRILFTLQQSIIHRKALRKLPFVPNMMSVNWQALYQSGIRVVVLDFDGVLAEDNALSIRDELQPVMNNLQSLFDRSIYILSNKPKQERQAYFAHYFPDIHFVLAKKKPYPDGLLHIMHREEVLPQEVLLVDDRLLTGGLASILAKTQCLIVKKPYSCFSKNACRECFFYSLRIIERLLFKSFSSS